MVRKIIKIDKEKCNGCGACVTACHENAIGLVNGKAVLLRDDYCDGLGDCLPTCPTNAISFEEREAAAYDEQAVKANQKKRANHSGCPGSQSKQLQNETVAFPPMEGSCLSQWPVQIKLAPVNAPYFHQSHLLIAADCTAYSYANFHQQFMKGAITLIGCPKLDMVDYSEKLVEIFQHNEIQEITVTRMEVPCCGGMEYAVKTALQKARKQILGKVVTLSIEGNILSIQPL